MASAARHRFGFRSERITPLQNQSAVAASLCRRTPNNSTRSSRATCSTILRNSRKRSSSFELSRDRLALKPNRTLAATRSARLRCGEKVHATSGARGFDRPIFRSPWSRPSLPDDVRAIRSCAKKRPSNGRHNVALRHKLFGIRRARASDIALATPGLRFTGVTVQSSNPMA